MQSCNNSLRTSRSTLVYIVMVYDPEVLYLLHYLEFDNARKKRLFIYWRD